MKKRKTPSQRPNIQVPKEKLRGNQRETSRASNGVLHSPAHSGISPKSNPFFFYALCSFSLQFSTPYQPATPPTRDRPGQSTNPPKDLRAGILAPQRPISQLEQPTPQGDDPPRWLWLRALAHRHGVPHWPKTHRGGNDQRLCQNPSQRCGKVLIWLGFWRISLFFLFCNLILWFWFLWGCRSEEEAKKKIYSVCTTTYTGFGALISEELSYKVKGKSFLGFWTEGLRVWV